MCLRHDHGLADDGRAEAPVHCPRPAHPNRGASRCPLPPLPADRSTSAWPSSSMSCSGWTPCARRRRGTIGSTPNGPICRRTAEGLDWRSSTAGKRSSRPWRRKACRPTTEPSVRCSWPSSPRCASRTRTCARTAGILCRGSTSSGWEFFRSSPASSRHSTRVSRRSRAGWRVFLVSSPLPRSSSRSSTS